MQNFIKKFPGQKKYELKKLKKKTHATSEIDPDTYFCTFVVNFILIVGTVMAIFTQRNFTEEYFIRRNILEVFA